VLLLTDISGLMGHLDGDFSFNLTDLHRNKRIASSYHCSRSNIVGMLVQKSAAYLFPCTIEYSLICAVTLYEMWKHIKIPPIRTKYHHVCTHIPARETRSASISKNKLHDVILTYRNQPNTLTLSLSQTVYCVVILYISVSQPFRRRGILDLALHISRYP
jgi:hypothetical protein